MFQQLFIISVTSVYNLRISDPHVTS